ncbi:hypothetical protein VKT23_011092 [Stygiomarasmius scandens]|uniref:Uncharacterized protein n=1 Tax=Marasmiellus scandens TaxID=2682957 RepID=A0ABR1J9V5_9AGAR
MNPTFYPNPYPYVPVRQYPHHPAVQPAPRVYAYAHPNVAHPTQQPRVQVAANPNVPTRPTLPCPPDIPLPPNLRRRQPGEHRVSPLVSKSRKRDEGFVAMSQSSNQRHHPHHPQAQTRGYPKQASALAYAHAHAHTQDQQHGHSSHHNNRRNDQYGIYYDPRSNASKREPESSNSSSETKTPKPRQECQYQIYQDSPIDNGPGPSSQTRNRHYVPITTTTEETTPSVKHKNLTYQIYRDLPTRDSNEVPKVIYDPSAVKNYQPGYSGLPYYGYEQQHDVEPVPTHHDQVNNGSDEHQYASLKESVRQWAPQETVDPHVYEGDRGRSRAKGSRKRSKSRVKAEKTRPRSRYVLEL